MTTPPHQGTDNSTNNYELADVRKYFGKGAETVRALDGVELTIAQGEFLAIQARPGRASRPC
jgi:ABC-type dipeptide/oligopeptide/nickel transport system ATPase subunit